MNVLMRGWFLMSVVAGLAHAASVRQERVPEQGVQPQVTAGRDGVIHLVYLKGPAAACDVRYATRAPGKTSWSPPVTVNDRRASAVAMGTIRGAQVAVSGDGTVHVVWNGPGGAKSPSALYYTRLEPGKQAFEPQRDLRGSSSGLDGGASVAAGADGKVFILWHGRGENAEPGELGRVVFVLQSTDNGRTFAPLKAVNADYAGVCACCSLKGFVAPDGGLFLLYRAARSMGQRDVTLLASRDGGQNFEHRIVGPWAISACPMSSMTLAAAGGGMRGAWEAEGKIHTAPLDGKAQAIAVSGDKARHPAMAVNGKGETLICWSTGTGWQRGGGVAWQVLDAKGNPSADKGMAEGVPVWGATAAYADGDGFVVMY